MAEAAAASGGRHAGSRLQLKAALERALRAQNPSEGELEWRLSRFDRGVRLVSELEAIYGSLQGAWIADLGAGHGGDTCAFLSAGGRLVAVDYRDYGYRNLTQSVAEEGFQMDAVIAAAPALPFRADSFDVAVAINLIEHLDDTTEFFRHLSRMLRPGAIAIVSVPVAWKGLRTDPYYGTPMTAILPMRLRRFVCERLLRRMYPFGLFGKTYYSVRGVVRAATPTGLSAEAHKFADSPLVRRVRGWPMSRLWIALVKRYLFDFVVLRKRGAREGVRLQPDGVA